MPKINSIDKTAFKRLVFWITEREKIRVAKEAGEPRPWTNDTILQTYRFCNVRRMDDKVSKWLLENWYEPNHSHKNMLEMIALARFLNRIETLEHIGWCPNIHPTVLAKNLRKYRDDGNAVFNGAYIVCGRPNEDKIESVMQYVASVRANKGELDTSSIRSSVNALQNCYGVGSFMAGQIVADARHAIQGTWCDRNEWAAMGPGSKKGMNITYGRPVKQALTQQQFNNELLKVRDELIKVLPSEITDRLEMIDYQNCFCELGKMCRAMDGTGVPKQLYKQAP